MCLLVFVPLLALWCQLVLSQFALECTFWLEMGADLLQVQHASQSCGCHWSKGEVLDKTGGGNFSLRCIHMETWAPGLATELEPSVTLCLAAQSCNEMDQGSRSLDLPIILRGSTGTQPQRLVGIWLGIEARPSSSSLVGTLGSVDEHSPVWECT